MQQVIAKNTSALYTTILLKIQVITKPKTTAGISPDLE